MPQWVDPDDVPELTEDFFEVAQHNRGGRVVKPATGYLGADGTVVRTAPFVIPIPGRPPERERPKQQVTLRLDADLLERFRATGAGWQTRINAALRKAAGI